MECKPTLSWHWFVVLVPNASRPFNFVQLFKASSLHVCYHNALSLPDMSLKREPTIERDNNLPILTDVLISYYSKSLALNLALFPSRCSYVHIPLKQHAVYFWTTRQSIPTPARAHFFHQQIAMLSLHIVKTSTTSVSVSQPRPNASKIHISPPKPFSSCRAAPLVLKHLRQTWPSTSTRDAKYLYPQLWKSSGDTYLRKSLPAASL